MTRSSGRGAEGPVGFVLSGGGSIGAVQVGMVQALFERGIGPDVLFGASVGACNGAFLASRPATGDTADELARVWSGLRSRDVFPFSPLTGLLGLLGLRDHVVSPRRLRRLLDAWVQFESLEQAATPLHVVATALLRGEELRLSTGNALSALLASAALPGVFPPVRRGGRVLVDGGVTNNTPLCHAVDAGVRRLYVLPTGYACSLDEAPRGAIGVATQSLSVLIQQRLVLDIQRVPEDVELVVLPPLCPLDVSPVDFSRGAEMIERSRRQSGEFLDGLAPGARHEVPDLMKRVSHHHHAH